MIRSQYFGTRFRIISMAVIGVIMLMTPGVVHAQHAEFLFSFGGSGAGNGKFNQPEGLALDSNGRLYVSDSNDRVQIFNPDATCGWCVENSSRRRSRS
jgi:hypothetical protein